MPFRRPGPPPVLDAAAAQLVQAGIADVAEIETVSAQDEHAQRGRHAGVRGIAFIEAMCFGLPCIGTAAWAVPEMVVDGETGFTIPVDDVDALIALSDLLAILASPAPRIGADAIPTSPEAPRHGPTTDSTAGLSFPKSFPPKASQTLSPTPRGRRPFSAYGIVSMLSNPFSG